MWSLRGALRHDLRYEGFEAEEGNLGILDRDSHDSGDGQEFDASDTRCNEKNLPLCRSPVYPPPRLINTSFALEAPKTTTTRHMTRPDRSEENDDAMSESGEPIDEDAAGNDGIDPAAIDAAAAALEEEGREDIVDENNHQHHRPEEQNGDGLIQPCISEDHHDSEDDASDSTESESEVEMVYGSLWKTSMITFSRETVEKYEQQKLSRKFYMTVMRDLRPLHLAVSSAERILAVTAQQTGGGR